MHWTEEHDVRLRREVAFINPYTAKKGSIQRSTKGGNIAQSLNAMTSPKFMVDIRSVMLEF